MKMIIGKYEATIYPEEDGWTGAISWGFDAAGKRQRVKRKGRTKARVKDKFREVVEDLPAGVTAAEGYTVADAISDFLDQGMKGKSAETVGNYRSLAGNHLIPYLGAAKLKKLTADELDTWMDDWAEELSTRTLRLIHQILERAIRHAQARDKVRRNVASLILVPEGQEGRPSKAMTLDQAVRLLDHIGTGSMHRLAAYVVVSLLAGVRTEEARALRWSEVDLDDLCQGVQWSNATSERLTGWPVRSLYQMAAVRARMRWSTRTATPAGVWPPCCSRSSWPLKVSLMDSMTWRSGLKKRAPARSGSPWRAGRSRQIRPSARTVSKSCP
jgi:Phage integrase, N-terminal SAM-like domain